MTPPPPLSSSEKFWSIFIPVAERHYESDKLVFGSAGSGSGEKDFVVEVLIRGADASGRGRRAAERVLEGWSSANGAPCELSDLENLRNVWTTRKSLDVVRIRSRFGIFFHTDDGRNVFQDRPDPTQNLSFNLNLTPEQQQSRAQVPLPYAHEGMFPIRKLLSHSSKQFQGIPMTLSVNEHTSAAILYDPDSADDLDDDDPDEDLDI